MAGKWLVQVLVRSWVDGSFKIGRSGLSTCPQSVSATWPTKWVERKKKIPFSREKVGLTNFRIFSLQT